MHLSAHEREIYYMLPVLSLAEELLRDLFFSSPQFMDLESELPMTIDARVVLMIKNVADILSFARQRLIGIDIRRQLWDRAGNLMGIRMAADFHELHGAMMEAVESGDLPPDLCKAVLAAFGDIAPPSPPTALADRRHRVTRRRPKTDEPPGA